MTAITITKAQLIALAPCDLASRLSLFDGRDDLNVAQALDARVLIRDVLWVVARLGYVDRVATFARRAADRADAYASDAATTRPLWAASVSTKYACESAARASTVLARARARAHACAAAVADYDPAFYVAAHAAHAADAAAAYSAVQGNAGNRAIERSAQRADLIELFSEE